MSYYRIPLKAGQPLTQKSNGTLLLIDSIGAASGVDVMLTKVGGSDGITMPNRQAAFRLVEAYEAVTFTAAVDTVIGVFLSTSDVQLGLTAGSAISVPGGVKVTNDPASPIPVNFTGTVAPVIGTLNNDDAHAVPVRKQALTVLVDMAPVNIGLAAAALVSDATLKRLTIRNSHPTAKIAIGGAGVTMANGARVLNPGDVWVEEDAAGAAWYAISDTANTTVQLGGAK
ncbi:MAG: hypothetical protein ACXVZR_03785 [Terriglobales bacterium]